MPPSCPGASHPSSGNFFWVFPGVCRPPTKVLVHSLHFPKVPYCSAKWSRAQISSYSLLLSTGDRTPGPAQACIPAFSAHTHRPVLCYMFPENTAQKTPGPPADVIHATPSVTSPEESHSPTGSVSNVTSSKTPLTTRPPRLSSALQGSGDIDTHHCHILSWKQPCAEASSTPCRVGRAWAAIPAAGSEQPWVTCQP